jgi:hypothetical protein
MPEGVSAVTTELELAGAASLLVLLLLLPAGASFGLNS